jgi:hypothetical protein
VKDRVAAGYGTTIVSRVHGSAASGRGSSGRSSQGPADRGLDRDGATAPMIRRYADGELGDDEMYTYRAYAIAHRG